MSHAQRAAKAKNKESTKTTKSPGGARTGAPRQHEVSVETPGLLESAGPALRLMNGEAGDGAAVQAKVTVGMPGGRFEEEADAVAQRVAQGEAAPAISSLPPGGLRAAQRQAEKEVPPAASETDEDVQRQTDDGEEPEGLPIQPQAGDGMPGAAPGEEPESPVQPSPSGRPDGGGSGLHGRAARAVRRPGPGTPLSSGLRSTVEPLFGRDFSRVRLHTGAEAQAAARSIDAHAFTHRHHIWLGAHASAADTSLIAHELAHVVQQGHAPPALQRAPGDFAHEEQPSVGASHEDETVQRFSVWGAVKSVGSSVASGARAVGRAAANVAGRLMELGRDALMAVVRRVAPDFARLIERDGLLGLLRSVVRDGFEALFGGVYDRITSAFDFEALREGFSGAVEAVQSVAGRLLEGDASAIFDAARSVSTLIGDTLSPVIDTIRSVAETVQEVFSGVMEVVGTPIMDFLERIGGAVWRGFTTVVENIGEIFSTVKDALGAAWSRVKGWFGITADEGTGEGGGIWQWVKGKAAGVWDTITGLLEPIMGPLRTVGRVLVMLSPAGPALLLYEYWPQLQEAFAWIREQWNDLNIVVRARDFLREQLLPTIKSFLLQVGEGVQEAADWLAENVGSVSSGVDAVLQALGGSFILRPLRSVIQFVQRQFSRAVSFVQTTIRAAGRAVRTLFQRLVDWIDPLLGVLRDLIAAIASPFGIPGLLIGGAWRLLPDALKGPIIDFILDLLRGFVRLIPPLPQIGLLWPFIRSGILGFLDRMRAFATERKVAVSNKIATIISGGSFSFVLGYLRGLATGIWEAVTGPFYAIAMLFDLPGMIRSFISMLGELFTGIAEEVRAIIQLVSERAEETLETILEAARELLENPGMLIDIISGAIQAALDTVGELGATFAERLMEIFEQPDEQLGESLGTLTGNILVEVLLAVFTAGVGNAVAGVGRVANLLRRVQRNFQRVLRLVADLMRPVLNFIDRIIDLFRGAMSRVGEIFQRIGAGFSRIVDRFRRLFQRLRGRRPDRAPDLEAPGRPPRAARPDTTPDVDTAPPVRPRADVDAPPARPLTRPPRDRDVDTDANRRRRRRDEDEDDDTARRRRMWRLFRQRVRASERRYRQRGLSRDAWDDIVDRHYRTVTGRPATGAGAIGTRTPIILRPIQQRGRYYHVIASMRPYPPSSIARVRRLPTGESRTDPIDITWYKPPSLYPSTILLRPNPSKWRSSDPLPSPQTVHRNSANVIDVPSYQRASNSLGRSTVTIGIAPDLWPRVGKIMRRVRAGPRRLGMEGKFKTLLRNYRYSWAGMAPDHVQDLGWNGPDALRNLWPLDRASNLEANEVYTQPIRYDDDGEVREQTVSRGVFGLWFRIEAIRRP